MKDTKILARSVDQIVNKMSYITQRVLNGDFAFHEPYMVQCKLGVGGHKRTLELDMNPAYLRGRRTAQSLRHQAEILPQFNLKTFFSVNIPK